jgi:tetratricopeptide (TPR) repeat protein
MLARFRDRQRRNSRFKIPVLGEVMGLQSDAFPSVASNAAGLPYGVRLKGWPLVGMIAFNGFILLVVLIVGVSLFRDSSGSLRHWWPGLVLAAACVFSAFRLLRLKDPEVVLYPDRLERPGLAAPRVIYRSEIAGVSKTVSSRYGSYFSIVLKPGQGEGLSLAGSLRNDPVFAEWLRGAPDPAAVAAAADRTSVLSDYRYGASEQERSARLDLSRKVVVGFSVLCVAVGAWLLFLYVPPVLALSASTACLVAAAVLVQLFNGLIVWVPAGGVRASPLAALIPIAALAFRGITKVHLVSVEPLMIVAGVGGIAVAIIVSQLRPGSANRLQSSLAIGVFGALAAYGAGAYLDALTVGKPIHSYVVTVEDKHFSSGRSTTYYLDLAAWGDRPAHSVSVPSGFYDETDVGSNVCIDLYRGDLGLPWFNVGRCLKPTETRDQLLQAGQALSNRGDFKGAAADLCRAAELDPGSQAAWGGLAMIHAAMGDKRAANDDVAKLESLDPNGTYTILNRAYVAEAQRRDPEALADYSKVLAAAPKDSFSRLHRANVEVRLGSYQAALDDIGQVRAAYPKDLAAPVIEARAYLGLNRLDDVRRVAAGLDSTSTDQAVLLTRAHIFFIAEDRQSSLATLDRAISLKPTAPAYLDRAQLEALSDPGAARADAETALRIAPGWPPAVHLLAGIDSRTKDEPSTPAAARASSRSESR